MMSLEKRDNENQQNSSNGSMAAGVNSRSAPQGSGQLLNDVNASQLNDKARLHLRAFARFVMWASPLFDMGHVIIKDNLIEFDLLISKRFILATGRDGVPRIEAQPSEFTWMKAIPWSQACVHFKSKKIFLISRPESPLSKSIFIIPVDIDKKMEIFKHKRYLDIVQAQLMGVPNSDEVIRLELSEMQDGFFTKRKMKNSL